MCFFVFVFQSHTILLVQPTKRPEGRTYADYESVNECMEGELMGGFDLFFSHTRGDLKQHVTSSLVYIDILYWLVSLSQGRTGVCWHVPKEFSVSDNWAKIQPNIICLFKTKFRDTDDHCDPKSRVSDNIDDVLKLNYSHHWIFQIYLPINWKTHVRGE